MLDFFSKLGVPGTLSQDVFLILIIAAAGFFLGMLIGRRRLVSFLINIYVSLAIVKSFPESFFPDNIQRMTIFFILTIGLTVFGKKLFDIYISGSGTGFLWRVFAMSFLEVILLFSLALSFLRKEEALKWVSENAYSYLATDWWGFLWVVAPLIFLLIIHKRIRH